MKITIYAPDINLTPDINEYLEKKICGLDKFVSRIDKKADLDSMVEARIKIERESPRGNVYKIGAEMILPRQVITATVQSDDVFRAIDELKDKLQREMRRRGGRREAIYRRTMRRFKDMRLWPRGRKKKQGGRQEE